MGGAHSLAGIAVVVYTAGHVCAFALLLACGNLVAADGQGTVSGRVFEAGGGPAALAQVTLIHRANGLRHKLVADREGRYRAPGLPAGSYTVIARALQDGASAEANVVVVEGERIELPIKLTPVWAAHESNGRTDVLLNGGNHLDAVRNAWEVTRGQQGGNIEGHGPYSPRGNTSFNSVGQRGQSNNFLVDGVDNNESWTRGAVLEPPAEVTEAVSLAAVYIPSNRGRATGGSINLQTRSGSNDFHGGAFHYWKNVALNARNFFDGAEKPVLGRSQFGGSVGGPLQKNDWFFFASPEHLRERRGLTVISTVPLAKQRGGDFAGTAIYDPISTPGGSDAGFVRQPFPRSRIPLSRIPQAARNLAGLFPDPNLPGDANNYRYTPDRIAEGDRVTARVDKLLSLGSVLFARLSYERHDLESPGALPAPAGSPFRAGSFAGSDSAQLADGAGTSLAAWSGVVSHAFRFKLTGYADDRDLDASAALGIPGLGAGGLPLVRPTGFAHLGAAGAAPLEIQTNSFHVENTLRWRKGRHNWSFGLQAIRRNVDGSASEWSSRGTFLFTPDFTSLLGVTGTGHSIASLLLGYPSEVRRDVQLEPFRLRGWELAGFVQDGFRIGTRLRIEAGLRYSLYPPPTEADDRIVNFNFQRQTPALDQFAGQQGVSRYGGVGFAKRTLSPRIGVALDLSGNGSTLLRGAFSMAYDTGTYLNLSRLARNPPFASRLDLVNGTFQVGANLTEGLPLPRWDPLLDGPSLNDARGAIYAIQTAGYTPYADQWGLFLQGHAPVWRLRREPALSHPNAPPVAPLPV
jgi:hypothetical protein